MDEEHIQKCEEVTPSAGMVSCGAKRAEENQDYLADHLGPHSLRYVGHKHDQVYAGLGPDYRVLVKNARKSAQKYYGTYREVEPVPMLVRDTAQVCQEYTQSGGEPWELISADAVSLWFIVEVAMTPYFSLPGQVCGLLVCRFLLQGTTTTGLICSR